MLMTLVFLAYTVLIPRAKLFFFAPTRNNPPVTPPWPNIFNPHLLSVSLLKFFLVGKSKVGDWRKVVTRVRLNRFFTKKFKIKQNGEFAKKKPKFSLNCWQGFLDLSPFELAEFLSVRRENVSFLLLRVESLCRSVHSASNASFS